MFEKLVGIPVQHVSADFEHMMMITMNEKTKRDSILRCSVCIDERRVKSIYGFQIFKIVFFYSVVCVLGSILFDSLSIIFILDRRSK